MIFLKRKEHVRCAQYLYISNLSIQGVRASLPKQHTHTSVRSLIQFSFFFFHIATELYHRDNHYVKTTVSPVLLYCCLYGALIVSKGSQALLACTFPLLMAWPSFTPAWSSCAQLAPPVHHPGLGACCHHGCPTSCKWGLSYSSSMQCFYHRSCSHCYSCF